MRCAAILAYEEIMNARPGRPGGSRKKSIR